jgi:hypothetical protein
VYAGAAAREGILNDTAYSEAGVDGRFFWHTAERTVVAAHVALHYMPTVNNVPFWALSSLGGDQSDVEVQPLRGYGTGRFLGRDSFVANVELRRAVKSFQGSATHFDLEVTPFLDMGRVFNDTSTIPFTHMHYVGGLGLRGVARPFVVGFLDLGYGNEGLAVFTGINYPF